MVDCVADFGGEGEEGEGAVGGLGGGGGGGGGCFGGHVVGLFHDSSLSRMSGLKYWRAMPALMRLCPERVVGVDVGFEVSVPASRLPGWTFLASAAHRICALPLGHELHF